MLSCVRVARSKPSTSLIALACRRSQASHIITRNNLVYKYNLPARTSQRQTSRARSASTDSTRLGEAPNNLRETTTGTDMEPGDEFCDPSSPRILTPEEVVEASRAIEDGVKRTACAKSESLSQECRMDIYLKTENTQRTGSFKERGARYALLRLSEDQKKKGVIAASCGNYAMALAYHGRKLHIRVTVVMPIVTPLVKRQRCREYGATVVIEGGDMEESRKIAMRKAQKQGSSYINGYDHPDVLAGQGTVGLEILEQVEDVDAVIVSVGGGGLIAGVATVVKAKNPNIQVIGVESTRCASFSHAMEQGGPQYIRPGSTVTDGLAVPTVGFNAFATAQPLLDKIVKVDEAYIALAILRLVENEKYVVEGAGATGLAAVLQGLLPELKGKRVVIILGGGNIDTTVLCRCLERGLAADGRLCRISVTIQDRPGAGAELSKIIADHNINIREMLFERAWLKDDVNSVKVKCVVETIDRDQAYELQAALRQTYEHVTWDVYGLWPGLPDLDVIAHWSEQ